MITIIREKTIKQTGYLQLNNKRKKKLGSSDYFEMSEKMSHESKKINIEDIQDFNILGNHDNCHMPLALMRNFWIPVGLVPKWNQTYKFPFRSNDVVIATYPKSGTHWIFYAVYLLKTNNFGPIPRHQQLPLVEYPNSDEMLKTLLDQDEPRICVTHLPAPLLAKHAFNGKVIYVYRNPKDVVVSLYHHCQSLSQTWPFDKTFEELVQLFMQGETMYGPYWKHVESYFKISQQQQDPGRSILFVKYEQMKEDTKGMLRKIATFLQVDFDENLIDRIFNAISVEKMRNNDDVNGKIWRNGIWNDEKTPFVRKGESGTWRDEFNDANLVAKFDDFFKSQLPVELFSDIS